MTLILKPSAIHGVGVFTTARVLKGSKIQVIQDGDWKVVSQMSELEARYGYKVPDQPGYYVPKVILRMSVGWYLNHSHFPNTDYDPETLSITTRIEIPFDTELTINYDRLQ